MANLSVFPFWLLTAIQARERKLQKPKSQMEFQFPVSGGAWMSVCLFNNTSGRNWTVLALTHQVASAHYLSVHVLGDLKMWRAEMNAPVSRDSDYILCFKCYRILQDELIATWDWLLTLSIKPKIPWFPGTTNLGRITSVFILSFYVDERLPIVLCFILSEWDLNDWDPVWYTWPLHSITTFCNSGNLPNHFRQNFVLHDVLLTNCLQPSGL